MRLSVIIPSRNGAQTLSDHLPTVCEEARRVEGTCEVIVIDDASDEAEDRSADIVAAEAPLARFLRQTTPGGFARTVNVGARAASGEALLFLNNDMHPEPGAFETLLRELERRDQVFSISPVIENLSGAFPESTTRVRWNRGVLDALFPGRRGQPPPGDSESREIAYACGGAFACRRRAFEELGGFPELHSPFYWEDADIGWRARRRGWSNLEIGDARVLHDHSRTIGSLYSARQIRTTYERNRLLFTWVHTVGLAAWTSHLAWMPLRLLAGLARGEPLLRSHLQALGRLGQVRRARRELKSTRPAAKHLLKEVRMTGSEGWPR